MNTLRKIAACVATWLIAAHPALALNDTIGVTAGAGKTANLIAFGGGNVISEVGICDATTANQCAAVSAGGALSVTGTLTAVTSITNALPAGTNVIGHVIADTGSTTAVTGTVTANATLSAETTKVIGTVNQGTSPWVTTANAGTNLNTSALALEAGGNLAAIKPGTDRLISSATNIAAGSPLATTSFVIGSRYLSTPPTFTNGQEGAFQIDANGRMLVSATLGANQTINEAQINGVTPLMGNGITGTGSQRVTIASDNTAFAVNAASTLNAETTKVIGTVRNLGNTGAITDFAGQNAASPANSWLMGAQFNTTPTTLTTGNASPLQMDSAGNLLVNIKAGAGSGGTALADKSAWTVSSTNLTPIGGEFTTGGATACATGQACTVAITAARELMVSATGLAAASTTSGQTGSMVMGAVSTSPPAYTTAQTNYVSLTTAGAVRTNLVADPTGGCTPTHTLSAATTNSTNIKNAAGTLCSVTIINNTATAADFRLYNLSAAPTCSSATGVVANYGVQANTTSPGLSPNLGTYGLNFDTGIGFCLTAYDGTDTNNSASLTGIQINLAYK